MDMNFCFIRKCAKCARYAKDADELHPSNSLEQSGSGDSNMTGEYDIS